LVLGQIVENIAGANSTPTRRLSFLQINRAFVFLLVRGHCSICRCARESIAQQIGQRTTGEWDTADRSATSEDSDSCRDATGSQI
jgi:hypothetical protein